MCPGMPTHTLLRSASRLAPFALVLGLAGSLAIAAAACGAGGDDGDAGSGGAGAGQTGTGTGEGGTVFTTGTGSGGSGGSGFEECATSSAEATLVPVNMIVMFDRSGSMDDGVKWPQATAALTAFVEDPGTAGLRVALRFFPGSGCTGTTCDIDVCSQPAVDAAPLTSDPAPADAQEALLVNAIAGEDPTGSNTPIYAALGGAEKWAQDYMAAHPTEKAVVVLVTDGQPNGCNENTSAIAGLAGQALAAAGVYTYAVGLEGSSESVMNAIAAEGGTGQGIFIGNGNAEAELLAALQAIQGSQVACEFQMPESQNGETIDPAKVNVTYTSGSGSPDTIGQVANAAACGNGGGWYYDNPAAPTTITLCPATCSTVQADEEAKIAIVVGCATEPAD